MPLNELRHRYGDTTIAIMEKGQARAIHLDGVDTDAGVLFLRYLGDSASFDVPYEDVKNSLLLEYPTLGMFNYNNWCLHVSRRAGRVYKRGIQADILSVAKVPNLRSTIYCTYDSNIWRDKNFVQELFTPTFYSLKEAADKVYSGERLGAAINSCLAITADTEEAVANLVYKTQKVGTVTDTGDVFISYRYSVMAPVIIQLLEKE